MSSMPFVLLRTAATSTALFMAVPSLGADVPEQGFLCCNMRTDGRWISDSNYAESGKRIVPVGTPVKFRGIGRYRANVQIAEKDQSIGNDYSRDLTMEEFTRRYIVGEDPRSKVAQASAEVRKGIETARVVRGMSRDQVLMAIGYPISSENPNLDARRWRYWLSTFSPFVVHFDDAGLVTKVETDGDTMVKVFVE
jgi:SmpA / OmlA family